MEHEYMMASNMRMLEETEGEGEEERERERERILKPNSKLHAE